MEDERKVMTENIQMMDLGGKEYNLRINLRKKKWKISAMKCYFLDDYVYDIQIVCFQTP